MLTDKTIVPFNLGLSSLKATIPDTLDYLQQVIMSRANNLAYPGS